MHTPDLGLARTFVDQNPPPGELLLCAITGSHHYGFPSPDSDLDIKGIHLAPLRAVLGLRELPGAFDRLTVFEGVECDLTTNELGQALSLLLKGNGNMLERIESPYQVVQTAELAELRGLARRSLSRRVFHHYAGYLRGMRREHQRPEVPRANSLLYTYRVALTGVHLLLTGEVVAHLPTLAPKCGFGEVLELVQRKVQTAEGVALSVAEAEHFRTPWPKLEAQLAEAREESRLPDEPPNAAEVEQWLVDRRLSDV